jgi:lipopolysaccharide O-acetyltransferase
MPKYDPREIPYLGRCWIKTKALFPGARLIRFPVHIKGAAMIDFGKNLTTGVGCRFDALGPKGCIRFGRDVQLNDYVHITGSSSVTIGDNVLIASKVYISDTSHGAYSGSAEHSNPDIPPKERPLAAKPVKIEPNVWIGEAVSVLPGITIGHGSIIGANSVVTKDVPANCIAVGNPAKVIKHFDRSSGLWERSAGDERKTDERG